MLAMMMVMVLMMAKTYAPSASHPPAQGPCSQSILNVFAASEITNPTGCARCAPTLAPVSHIAAAGRGEAGRERRNEGMNGGGGDRVPLARPNCCQEEQSGTLAELKNVDFSTAVPMVPCKCQWILNIFQDTNVAFSTAGPMVACNRHAKQRKSRCETYGRANSCM